MSEGYTTVLSATNPSIWHQHLPRWVFVLLLPFLFSVCTPKKARRAFTIGFSQCMQSDAWRQTMLDEMKRELSLHDHIRLINTDAGGNSQRQVAQIKELVRQKVDLLIVSPNEVHPLSPAIEEVYKSGIPVVVIDRRTNSKNYTAFIGASNFEVGQNAGRYAAFLLKGKGRIIEVTGLPDASPVIDRHEGFMDVIGRYPGIQYLHKIDGNWDLKSFDKTVDSAIRASGGVDLIYAQNDRMAQDVYQICRRLNLHQKVKIIGVDGLAAKGEGLEMVEKKEIAATVLYPTGGQEAIRTAVNILSKKPFRKENQLFTTIIDSSNVQIMKLQNEKVLAQQQEIDQRRNIIEQQRLIGRNQTTVIYIISLSLVLTLISSIVLFYYYHENKKITRQMAAKNQEILSQQEQLIAMTEQAQKANEAKVNFFTNISHEFRTPLTLILGPLEELLANQKLNHATRQSLTLIQNNVLRLLRLFNQLMDFRKIELEKMKLRTSENNLVAFVAEIVQAYKSMATRKNIDLRIITEEHHLPVWFDTSMLDKVIFNLLSNAFKFTKDNGFIHVYISRNRETNSAVIKVEDNGIGMKEEAVRHAFDVFYQGEFENYKGSGLGLALSRELIQLHRGTITVASEKWKGTSFEISLPLGNDHLQPDERVASEKMAIPLYEQEKIFIGQMPLAEPDQGGETASYAEKEHTLLIIEDNADLRLFLSNRLKQNFEVLEADNSQRALELAFDMLPDLILCDVILPGKSGIELTSIFKTDVRTAHIPVILLTARTDMEQQIEGMATRADLYMTKPFNVPFLEASINSLIANREKLKQRFTAELPMQLKSGSVNKPDKKFINEFTAIVESNIGNEQFSVEDICKAMSISKVHLYRKVKALLHTNISDYIMDTRMQKAKYLMQNESLNISEVAYKVGFASPGYFSTVFKSKVGMTPKAFRESKQVSNE